MFRHFNTIPFAFGTNRYIYSQQHAGIKIPSHFWQSPECDRNMQKRLNSTRITVKGRLEMMKNKSGNTTAKIPMLHIYTHCTVYKIYKGVKLYVEKHLGGSRNLMGNILWWNISYIPYWFVLKPFVLLWIMYTGLPPDNESASQGPLIRDCKDGFLQTHWLQRESTFVVRNWIAKTKILTERQTSRQTRTDYTRTSKQTRLLRILFKLIAHGLIYLFRFN